MKKGSFLRGFSKNRQGERRRWVRKKKEKNDDQKEERNRPKKKEKERGSPPRVSAPTSDRENMIKPLAGKKEAGGKNRGDGALTKKRRCRCGKKIDRIAETKKVK